MNTVYNTTGISGAALRARQVKNGSQCHRVLEFFEQNPDSGFTPFQVQRACLRAAPVTSVRRALTRLTELGYLVKGDQVIEMYGEVNHKWYLVARTCRFENAG